MADITSQQIQEAIVKGISEAIDVKTKDFYIEREDHYQHHEFIKEFIELMKTSKKTATRVIVGSVVAGVMGLIVLGIWAKVAGLIK